MLKTFLLKHWFDVLLLLGVASLLLVFTIRHSRDQSQILNLQNQNATFQKTIQDSYGVYTKQVLETNKVQSDLDNSNAQIKSLTEDLSKRNEQLSTATSLQLMYKKAYEGIANAKQSTQPSTPTATSKVERLRVDFNKDFGFVGVNGYTLTNPAFAWVDITQNRPLKLTLAISQDKSGVFHSYVTSSEDNVQANIDVSVLNPSLQQHHWYEHLGVQGDLGFGSTSVGAGALAGVGVMVDLGAFTVGPKAWVAITNRVDNYYGVGLTWRPFVSR